MMNLDRYAGAYTGENAYDVESMLTFKWYVERIIRSANPGSALELGIGFGFTTIDFANYFSKHIVLEGSQEVISNFREKNAQKIKDTAIIHTLFEEYETE